MKSGAEEGGRSGGWGLGLPGRPRMDRISFCISFFSRPLSLLKLEWTTASACWLHRERKSRSSRGRRSRVLGCSRGRWRLEEDLLVILLQRQEKLWETSESMSDKPKLLFPVIISPHLSLSSLQCFQTDTVFFSSSCFSVAADKRSADFCLMCLEESFVYRLKLPLFISPSPFAFLCLPLLPSLISKKREKKKKKTPPSSPSDPLLPHLLVVQQQKQR